MNQKFKKFTSVSLAALLGLTAAPASAFAESYTEIEKAALTEAITDFAAGYERSLKGCKMLQTGIHEDITFTLKDGGRSLMGLLLPVDISWFQDLRLSADISMNENGSQFMTAGFYMNDTKLFTLDYFFDMENMDLYMQIPELREGYIKADYDELMRQQQVMLDELEDPANSSAVDEAAMEALEEMYDSPLYDPEFLRNYMTALSNLPDYLPTSSDVEELLNKYTSILFDNLKEEEAATETLDFAGTKAECTIYESRLSRTDTQTLLKTVIETAKTDEQIKEVLNKLDEQINSETDLYQSFLAVLEETADDLNKEIEEDGSYLSATVSVDENGKAVSRSLILHDTEESIPVYEWKHYVNGENFVSELQIGPVDEALYFGGQGTIVNGILEGTYDLQIEGQSLLNIEVTDYDTNSSKDGSLYGSYRFFVPAAASEGEVYNPLENLSVLADIASDKDSEKFSFSIDSAGASLADIIIEAAGTTMEKTDLENLTEVYDILDQAAMNEYASGISPDTILNNLVAAGMPQELLMQLLTGGTAPQTGTEGLAQAVPEA